MDFRSPLILSTDLASLDPTVLGYFKNKDVIRINVRPVHPLHPSKVPFFDL